MSSSCQTVIRTTRYSHKVSCSVEEPLRFVPIWRVKGTEVLKAMTLPRTLQLLKDSTLPPPTGSVTEALPYSSIFDEKKPPIEIRVVEMIRQFGRDSLQGIILLLVLYYQGEKEKYTRFSFSYHLPFDKDRQPNYRFLSSANRTFLVALTELMLPTLPLK